MFQNNSISTILDGKSLSQEILDKIKTEVQNLRKKPTLATVLVGEDSASYTYVKMKIQACQQVGIESKYIHLSQKTTTDKLLNQIKILNQDSSIDGILLQHPCPSQIEERKCFDKILPEKDVDGVTTSSFGRLSMGVKTFFPCTPFGIILLLQKYKINLVGKKVVIVGRSPILGKPLAMLLDRLDATITLCHSKTQNLPEIIQQSDVVVGALGKPKYIQSSWIKKGCILIDAGYNRGNIGDIDLENCKSISSYHTPVPGGVGPMTIAVLLLQTLFSNQKKFLSLTENRLWK